jgi:hypothetical protein
MATNQKLAEKTISAPHNAVLHSGARLGRAALVVAAVDVHADAGLAGGGPLLKVNVKGAGAARCLVEEPEVAVVVGVDGIVEDVSFLTAIVLTACTRSKALELEKMKEVKGHLL